MEDVLEQFACEHLTADLREFAQPFGQLAWRIAGESRFEVERDVALGKLLEARNAAMEAK